MHLKARKENRVSSWGLMGDLCTSAVWRDVRATADPLALRDLQVLTVLRARKERSGFQVDQVDQGSTAPEERREIPGLDLDLVTPVLQAHRALLDPPDLLLPSTDSEVLRITPDITQRLKERKVIKDFQGYLKFQVADQALTFTL